ncbi:MAG: metallophosphoesterase family protein [Thermoguttaceae bacterium]
MIFRKGPISVLATILLQFCFFPTLFAESPLPASTPLPVQTTRESPVRLSAPLENDSFTFLVFADHTSGNEQSLNILGNAVQDANRLSPSFVMNVGDMVQGYGETADWCRQKDDYQSVMNSLSCPWYPTVGNHDVYWRTPNRVEREHEAEYETYFGPLWYAFEYKDYWFIVLFTDEGNPETGEKSFSKKECQTMSDAQFNWLLSVLKQAEPSKGIFVFQHHPRWALPQYGEDWNKVHKALCATGKVLGVFAGHTHKMFYENRDGIEYFVLPATGGKLRNETPEQGVMQAFYHVSVHPQKKPGITAIPVNGTVDVRTFTDIPKD